MTDDHGPLFICKDTRLATFSCPYCNTHVHRGEMACASCGRDVHLMAQQLYWGPLLYNRALKHAQGGDYEHAVRLLHRARTLLPDRREPYVLLAKLEAYLGNYEGSDSWIGEALERQLLTGKEARLFTEALDTLKENRPKLVRSALKRGLSSLWPKKPEDK